MDSLDDYFEYAMDLPEDQREQLLVGLRASEPGLAAQLEAMLRELVNNPDFACHGSSLVARGKQVATVRAVALPVADVARAVAWYTEVFGCRVVRQEPQRAVVAFANLELHLTAPQLDPPVLTLVAPDVPGLATASREANGARVLRMTDPWGNALEVRGEA